ncbi:hypothetical protein DRE_00709 [Drechslerella stenobrocha 248]|uniref:CCHC-type domain-containing protein n=1 Tax=Drechslerella stenobrocha 248 TaxID=1043628 RepID=W7I8G3_9PEZI|nr:hypothetical protein DRE_00709 [Drechslerella stenobrocha 248]
MDNPPKQDANILSMINDIQADLESKTNAIAEIQRDVGRLCSALLGGNIPIIRQEPYPKTQNQLEPKAPYEFTSGTPVDRDLEDHGSVGTTLTKVSVSGTPPVPYLDPETKDGLLIPSSVSNVDYKTGQETAYSTKNPAWYSGDVAPSTSSIDPVSAYRPPPDTLSNMNCQEKIEGQSTDIPPGSGHTEPPTNPQFTTQVMVNGVPRRIPSTLKVSARFKKHDLAPTRESLGPSEPISFTRTIRASAPARFSGWKTSTLSAHNLAKTPTIFESSPGPVMKERQASQQHNSRKSRSRACNNCGDPSHIQKHCKKKASNQKQLGSDGGCSADKPVFHRLQSTHQPVTRPCEKAPGYPIDRQFELIDTIQAHNRMIQHMAPNVRPNVTGGTFS